MICVNTAYHSNSYWDTGDLGYPNKLPQIVRSEWRDGGTLPLAAVGCNVLSPFSNTYAPYPDAVYRNTTAAAITLAENNSAVRGTLPALFSCYHNLHGVVNDMDFVDMADGQKWIKLNIADTPQITTCFVLNIEEWEI